MAKGVALISHKEKIDTDTHTGEFMLTVFAALSQLEREQLKQRQREGIELAKAQGKYTGQKLSQPTGRGSGSSMGNGKPSISQGENLCGEWKCRQILSTAVCVSINSVTVSLSRPQLDRLANGKAPQCRSSLWSEKLTDEKSVLSESSERTHTVSMCLLGICLFWNAP